jgi:hypothetical protein
LLCKGIALARAFANNVDITHGGLHIRRASSRTPNATALRDAHRLLECLCAQSRLP